MIIKGSNKTKLANEIVQFYVQFRKCQIDSIVFVQYFTACAREWGITSHGTVDNYVDGQLSEPLSCLYSVLLYGVWFEPLFVAWKGKSFSLVIPSLNRWNEVSLTSLDEWFHRPSYSETIRTAADSFV